MSVVKPLRQLIALRQRRQERLDAAVSKQILQLRDAEQELDRACADEAACADREQVLQNKRRQVTESSFAPLDLVITDLDVKVASAATYAAAAKQAKAQSHRTAQLDLLVDCKGQATRNLQRIDDLKERVANVLRERAALEEESDAEESEEIAASRIAGRRAAREEARRA
jgi:hypothetical protein